MNFLCFALVFGLFQSVKVGGITKCGTSDVHFEHTTGNDRTERGEWPFLTALYEIEGNFQQRFLYGGTIISNRHVLTVAHGIDRYYASKLRADQIVVIFGGYNLNKTFEEEVIRSYVDEVCVHPDWKGGSGSYDANIAILKLKQSLVFTTYVRPVCIATDDLIINLGAMGYFVGWGIREDESTVHVEFPRRGLTNALNASYCYTTDPTIALISSRRTFCGGRGDAAPGRGDSGSGFFVRSGYSWVQYGILAGSTSHYQGTNTINIYTNVALFKDWIVEIVTKSDAVICSKDQSMCEDGQRCISDDDSCNSRFDCADKSDESPTLCGDSITASTQSCQIPKDLADAKAFYAGNESQDLLKGSSVDNFVPIIYKCSPKYVLEGSTSNLCLNGQWTNEHPKCRKYCSSEPLSGVTIKVSCNLLDATVPCGQQHPPETLAHITCAVGYRKPVDRTVVEVIRCGDDGQWDYYPFRCEQVCGLEAPEIVTYIVGSEHINITKVPWHVGVYNNHVNGDVLTQICGGTIVNAKLVVSTAHCVWDVKNNRLYPASQYKIGAGKYYRDINAKEPNAPQIVGVTQIIVKQEYLDYDGRYDLDIALFVIESYLKFNFNIKPICVETKLGFNEKYVPSGLIGKVAGWGLEESGGQSSAELKYIDLPTFSYHECTQVLPVDLHPFITGDKFCAGYTTGQSVCQGDSGGGLVFPKTVGSHTLYFLGGIVSAGGNKAGSCDNDKYTQFTNVKYYTDMIEYYEPLYRPK